ncbi:MAG: ribosome biogenesis GTPase Der [Patescibacteria group bacterium]
MGKKIPQVAIVGRTNAGKSTLFNRLSETHKAIVSSLVNTTRDRNFANIYWLDKEFTLVDTGGLDTAKQDQLGQEIQKQVKLAINQADLILFIVDGTAPLMPQDKTMAKLLYKTKKPVILGINKIDNRKKQNAIDPDFFRLNFSNIAKFSAINGAQTGDLLDLITSNLPTQKKKTSDKKFLNIKLAIIGRPNVGKSSLINAILGEERVITSDIAHTTRDVNDIDFFYKDTNFTLVDTAGLRRKSKVGQWSNKLLGKIEKEGIGSTIRYMEKADITILVLEAQKTVTAQDLALVQLAMNYDKNLIIVINKWDLIPDKDEATINEYTKYFDAKIPFVRWVPMVFTSALTGQRVRKILDLALEVYNYGQKKIPAQELKILLDNLTYRLQPKQHQVLTFGQEKSPLKLKWLEQVKTSPHIFKLVTPTPKNVPPAIVKILEKTLREKYEFLGVPIKIVVSK